MSRGKASLALAAQLLLACTRDPWLVPATDPRCGLSPTTQVQRATLEASQAREEQLHFTLHPEDRESARNRRIQPWSYDRFRAEGERLFYEDAPWTERSIRPIFPSRISGTEPVGDATRCAGCHHRGGRGGSGSIGDIAHFAMVGDDVTTARRRLPKMLAGAALLELAARDDSRRHPFGWSEGRARTLREMVQWSAQVHLGERPSSEWVDAIVTFVASIPAPIQADPPTNALLPAIARGEQLFATLGCASCHTPSITVRSPIVPLANGRSLDLRQQLSATGNPPYVLRPYSDLRVHSMGKSLEDIHGEQLWITAPLWGIASRRLYLHDGRAVNFREAILAHGGEAQPSRDRFEALGPEAFDLYAFLTSLDRTPCVERAR